MEEIEEDLDISKDLNIKLNPSIPGIEKCG